MTKFPIGNPNNKLLMATKSLFKRLMENYKFNSEIKNRGESEFQEFNWIKSKPIVDQIDEVISGHFGLSIEETDFIINYDIKYRMGQ